MDVLTEKSMHKHLLIREFFKKTNGKTDLWFDLKQVANSKLIKDENFSDAYYYLLHEGYIKPYGAGYTSFLTQNGIKYIESLDNMEEKDIILKTLMAMKNCSGFVSVDSIFHSIGIREDVFLRKDILDTMYKLDLIEPTNYSNWDARVTPLGRKLTSSSYDTLLNPVDSSNEKASKEKKGFEQQQNVMTKKMTGKIFISHATKDREVVSKFCDLILGNGLNLTVEEIFNTSHEGTKPKTGADFRGAIKNELMNAKIVLQFISPAYKVSEACLNEMGAAWVLSDNVKPLILEKGEYEVGFIHSTTQQAQLHNEAHIIRLTDELREEGIYEGNVKNEVLFKKIKEFVNWLNEYDRKKEVAVLENLQDKEEEKRNYEKDLAVIRTYLQQKSLHGISLESLAEKINPKYTLEYIIQLIEVYPDKLTRAKILGKPGIRLVAPDLIILKSKI